MSIQSANSLFQQPLRVLGLGLQSFSDNLTDAGGQVLHLAWQPIAEGDDAANWTLATLLEDQCIKAANEQAMQRYLEAQPALIGVSVASREISALNGKRRILHAGPPIDWSDMCGPMQGAIAGAIVFEGWARDVDSAMDMAARGDIALEPCHHYQAVGPMSGIISPSMPIWVVENRAHGNRAFCNFNEGLGKVLRFGANSDEVLNRLRWMGGVLAPTLAAALEQCGEIELKPLIAQALHMGDECHNRNAAASGLLFKRLAPTLARLERGPEVLEFIAANDHFFLNLSMAACKVMLDAAHGVPHSTMVTVMAPPGVRI
ncbi:YlbE family protein, partial [Aeromonas veronii]